MQIIDEHEFSNGTFLFTREGEAARYFTDNIKVGMVGVNVPVPVAYHSFGGWRRSLFDGLSANGPDAIRFLYAPQDGHSALAFQWCQVKESSLHFRANWLTM